MAEQPANRLPKCALQSCARGRRNRRAQSQQRICYLVASGSCCVSSRDAAQHCVLYSCQRGSASVISYMTYNSLLRSTATGILERPGLDQSQPGGAPATQSGLGSSDTVRGKKLGGGAYRWGRFSRSAFPTPSSQTPLLLRQLIVLTLTALCKRQSLAFGQSTAHGKASGARDNPGAPAQQSSSSSRLVLLRNALPHTVPSPQHSMPSRAF